MRVALFCHAEGDPLNENIQQELYRQYTQLEDYAHQNDFVIEYAVFHTGVFNFDQPDKTLLALIQRAQAKDFDMILVESQQCFPLMQADCLPPIQLYFLKEAQLFDVGQDMPAPPQQVPASPDRVTIYFPEGHCQNFDFFLQ